jgi:hypothetical protein
MCRLDIFDIDSEENKLEYTPLFDRYVEKVGKLAVKTSMDVLHLLI